MSGYDTFIVGGGLAGLSAAIHLAKHGHSVGLAEAKTYPHHKVCGEFMSPECDYLLNELGVSDQLWQRGMQRIRDIEITAPNGVSWQSQMPADALGISRYAIDEILAKHARELGVDVFEKTPIIDIQGNLSDGYQLSARDNEFSAQTLIGAQGKRSHLDRALKRAFLNKPQPYVGLKNHFYGPPLPNQIKLHVFEGGYCGMSEVEDGMINVCLLVQSDIFQRTSGQPSSIPTFIDWMMQQNETLGEWLSQAEQIHDKWLSIAQVPFVKKERVINHMLMTGDSAGLIAPLAGNGMAMALEGGKLAANHTHHYLSGQASASFADEYSRDWQSAFGGRLRLSRMLQGIMLRPSFIQRGLQLVNIIPPLGTVLINQTRDLSFQKRLEKPS